MPTLTKILCDFCDADVPEAWYFRHRAFAFTLGSHLVNADAGQVAACAVCRPLVDARDIAGLLLRAFKVWETPGPRAYVAAYHKMVLQHLTGRVQHARLGDDEPPLDRFFEDTCPRCGTVRIFDRQAVGPDNCLHAICRGCGLQIDIVAVGKERPLK